MVAASTNSAEDAPPALADGQRLIVVANRLPVTIGKDDKGEYTFKMSSGGLVSALSGCKKTMAFTWIGWPGLEIPLKDQPLVQKRLMDEFQCQAVFLPDGLADAHYNGFSNSILWPLFHYHPGEMNFDPAHWLAYRSVNLLFAKLLLSLINKGDIVWVQDYHLMLLPMMLRGLLRDEDSPADDLTGEEMTRLKEGVDLSVLEATSVTEGGASEKEKKSLIGEDDIKIGFFLHTPFPSSEIYRILPVRREILLGILHCDLIGFHTYDYARHFLSSCTRILGIPTMPNGVEVGGRYAHVGTFPIGIEPNQFVEGLKKPTVAKRIKELTTRFDGCKIIVGVDRLDYIKGVPQKLHALEIFLSEHPEWIGKVVLVQLAVPSRQDVEEYQNLRSTVNELVGRINGRFGTVEFMPIHFMHKSVPFDELCAMYAVADACLVTSTRDGMNLVSYEYIATQSERHGSMILSEFAGAAQSLNGSLIINPWDVHSTANAIFEAVTMTPQAREANFNKLWKYVNKYTAEHWGNSFVRELTRIKAEDEKFLLEGGTGSASLQQNLPEPVHAE